MAAMKRLTTPSERKSFRYKGDLNEELIIYLDENGKPQDKFALVITPYVIKRIKTAIRQGRKILMGANRDNPSRNSLGALLKAERQTPQQLSYLIPILK